MEIGDGEAGFKVTTVVEQLKNNKHENRDFDVHFFDNLNS